MTDKTVTPEHKALFRQLCELRRKLDLMPENDYQYFSFDLYDMELSVINLKREIAGKQLCAEIQHDLIKEVVAKMNAEVK